MERIRILRKHLLCFLLLSLTVFSDGWGYACKADAIVKSSANTAHLELNDFLDLMCDDTKTMENGRIKIDQSVYWGISCVTNSNSCAGNQHVIVWGKHKKGNEQGVYTGVDIYKCIDKGDDEWDALTKGYDMAYQLINDCGSTVDGMTKVVSTNGYDIYVRVIDAFSKCETRAYTFASMSSSYICKKAADVAEKKCGKTPNELGNSVLVEKNDSGDVKTWYAKDGAFAETEKMIFINTVCDSLNDFNEFVKFGSWNSTYDIYVKEKLSETGCFNASRPYSSENDNNWSFADVCLKCKDGTSYDQSKDVCVSDSGGGDSGGGDSSAESQVEQEICGGVKCNSGMNGKSIFCAENKDDTYVYKCDSGQWSEVGVYGYCCNKNCSKPKKTNLISGGSWTTDTGHEMWFSPTALIKENAWLFNSTDVNNNCTICKDGTRYNKTNKKCE